MQRTSQQWISHYQHNATQLRIDWKLAPSITPRELKTILPSLRTWQLGETSDGKHLLHVAGKYARSVNDPHYVAAVQLFIREEQKHGNNLGRYLDAIQQPRAQTSPGDSFFRKMRYFNASMEIWTLTVLMVESTAQIFYQCMKNATNCALLKQICTDILIDEAYHIDFQTERLSIIFSNKSSAGKMLRYFIYPLFFFFISTLAWVAYRKLFRAGGTGLLSFLRKMNYKYRKTLLRMLHPSPAPDINTIALH